MKSSDGFGHVGVRQPDKTLGQIGQSQRRAGRGQSLGDLPQTSFDRRVRKRKRKVLGRNPAQIEIHVGDRQRPTPPITGRPRIGPGAIGPDHQFHAVEAANRSTAGRDGLDGQHRRHDSDACLFGFVFKSKVPSNRETSVLVPPISKPIDRGSRQLGHSRKSHHSAGRP